MGFMVIDGEGVGIGELLDGTRYVDGVWGLDGTSVNRLVNTGVLDMLVGTMLSVDVITPWVLDITSGNELVLFVLIHSFLSAILKPVGHCLKHFKSSPELE